MGVKFNPGLKAAGIDPSTVQKLIDAQKIPVESAKKRKEATKKEKDEFDKLTTCLTELDAACNSLKTRYDFYKLKFDSSHPDIIDGAVKSGAMLGTYEMEVRALARADKKLALGYPDKNDTPVGFGYMTIERDDGEQVEVVVEPDTTLQQLAMQINESNAGVRAMVVNTKYQPEPYRLLIVSEQSGQEARVTIDEDTTSLEFNDQVTGRNLDVLFEDVPVTDTVNTLNDLIEDVSFNIRRSEPGTRVQVSIVYDIEATQKAIKNFVDKYNGLASFVNNQFVEDPKTGRFGLLAGDSTIKLVMRQLQATLVPIPKGGEKFNSLAEIGITTNAKTGTLAMDDAKVKASLTENYDSVANLFIRNKNGVGTAEALSEKIKNLRDPGFGAVKSKMRGLERIITSQDEEIARRERQLEQKEQEITHRFTNLESSLASLQGQGEFLKARFGNSS